LKKKASKILSAFLAVSMLLAFAGCSGQAEESSQASSAAPSSASEASSGSSGAQSALDRIKANGELVVGTASGYPPYEFVDVTSPTQEAVGIDMALAKAISDKIGVKLKIEDMDFTALLSSLTTNKVDLAIAGINPTDERKKTVDFSDVYLQSEQKLLIRKSDAAEKSSTQETLAKAEMTSSKVVALDKTADLVMELMNKKIDGVVIESTVAEQYILSNDGLAFSPATFKNKVKNSSIALKKGQEDLLKVVNEVIAENKSNGDFDKWVEDYSKKASTNAK
jgi:polar amino acid transport system substrate-binding protein